MGYYQHRAFDQPLWYPGLQDMTAFVDFTAVAEAAVNAGFSVDGFTSQANFLIDCGLPELLEQQMPVDEKLRLILIQQMKTLTMNTEMGERFKVMGLSKNFNHDLAGFNYRNYLYRL